MYMLLYAAPSHLVCVITDLPEEEEEEDRPPPRRYGCTSVVCRTKSLGARH
jgi:hypothetical protein